MDGTGEHYAKWNKPGGERQIPYDFACKWNLINNTNKQAKYNQRHWNKKTNWQWSEGRQEGDNGKVGGGTSQRIWIEDSCACTMGWERVGWGIRVQRDDGTGGEARNWPQRAGTPGTQPCGPREVMGRESQSTPSTPPPAVGTQISWEGSSLQREACRDVRPVESVLHRRWLRTRFTTVSQAR